MSGAKRWETDLLPAFLDRVRTRLKIAARPDSAAGAEVARRMAARAAFVRWPPEGGAELMLGSDPDVRAALEAFPRLSTLLAAQSCRSNRSSGPEGTAAAASDGGYLSGVRCW